MNQQIHDQPHPLAGQTVKLAVTAPDPDQLNGAVYQVEDYWDRVTGSSWMWAEGNPAALKYAMRSGFAQLPTDDDVVYGKVSGIGHIVHVSELVVPSDREATS